MDTTDTANITVTKDTTDTTTIDNTDTNDTTDTTDTTIDTTDTSSTTEPSGTVDTTPGWSGCLEMTLSLPFPKFFHLSQVCSGTSGLHLPPWLPHP